MLKEARSSAPRPFHLMAKPTGAVCNLDCEYCFYLAKESLYPGSDFRMPDDILERYVAGLLAAHAGLPEVVVAFQGGEPGLNWPCAGYQAFFRHVDEPMRVMASLLDVGNDADAVTAWYAKNRPEIPLAAEHPRGGAP